MSQRLTSFVVPATDPLSTMKGQLGHLSTSIKNFDGQLQRQAAHLTSGNGNADFQGLTADAFSKAIEYYLNISTQHTSVLEQAATIMQTCVTEISSAVSTANAKNLNDILVNYVLDRVTLDEVLQQGSPPVEAVLNEMRQKLKEMVQSIQKFTR
jgi:predicted nucleotide-binding protein